MPGILEGLRIVEVSAFVAAPLAGLTLAQMGAQVIRVDPLGGGLDYGRLPLSPQGRSLYWAGLNKNKRSVALDLRNDTGRALLEDLITAPGAEAGILITNLSGGAVPSYEQLVRKRADVIVLQIVGNPDGSPAVDYTVNCAVGFPDITGPSSSREPVNHVLPAWDVLCGTTAALAVLAAQRHRRITGEGQRVRIALSDIAMATAGHLGFLAEAQICGERGRYGNALYGTFGRDFETRDGRRVMIVAVTARQWLSILEATGIGEAVAAIESREGIDCRREEHRWRVRDQLFALVEDWTRARSYGEVRDTLERHRVLWGPYQTFTQLLAEDARCSLKNPTFGRIEQPGIGSHLAPGSAIEFMSAERVPVDAAPALGRDTRTVLADVLGLSDARLGELQASGVIQ